MSDNKVDDNNKPAPDAQPPANPPENENENDDDDDEFGDEESLSPEESKKLIKALRAGMAKRRQAVKDSKVREKKAADEAAALRKEKEDAETDRKKKNGEWESVAKDKDKTIEEKEKAIQRANERSIRAELRAFAIKEGIKDPSDVNHMSLEGLSIDDETGDITGAEKAIKKLKSEKPHYFKESENKDDGGKGKAKPTSSSLADPPEETESKPKDLSKMSNAEFADHKKQYIADLRKK